MNETSSQSPSAMTRPSNLDLQQLRYAVLAADLGSLRRAADVSLVKQSTLSRSIQQLEHMVGVTLFERSSGGVRPTLAGRNFVRITRSILEQMDALVSTTRATGRGEAGRLAIGFCTSLAGGNLRATMLEFRQRHPQIVLATVERSRPRLATALQNSVLDVLIVTGDRPSLECKMLPLWSERIFVVLPQDHPLVPRDAIYWTDLRDQTLLQYHPGRELEDILTAKLVLASDRPRIERHDVSRGVVKSLIIMGLGLSLVLESDIDANSVGLIYREMRDGTGPSHIGFSVIWRPDNENPALVKFLSLLGERFPLVSS